MMTMRLDADNLQLLQQQQFSHEQCAALERGGYTVPHSYEQCAALERGGYTRARRLHSAPRSSAEATDVGVGVSPFRFEGVAAASGEQEH